MDFFPQQWTNNGQRGVRQKDKQPAKPHYKRLHRLEELELVNGLEPPTCALRMRCSTD